MRQVQWVAEAVVEVCRGDDAREDVDIASNGGSRGHADHAGLRPAGAVIVLVVVQDDRGGDGIDMVTDHFVPQTRMAAIGIVVLERWQIGIRVDRRVVRSREEDRVEAFGDLGSKPGEADVVQHRADGEVGDVFGLIGNEAASLMEEIELELEAHEDGEERNVSAVADIGPV